MLRTFFHRVMRARAPSIFCPFYHAVRADVPPHLKFLYPPRTPDQFKRDIQTFGKYFDPIDPLRTKDKKPLGRHQILLSFDDGLRSFKEVAWPVLKRHGIRPILFVNPSFIDRPTMMYRYKASLLMHLAAQKPVPSHPYFQSHISKLLQLTYAQQDMLDELAEEWGVDWTKYVEEERPYLSLAELRQLVAEGVYIGAHSMDHPYYQELDLAGQIQQTQASLDWVQDKFDVNYRFFSFPFTDEGVSAELWERVDVDASFGTQKIKKESWPAHHQRLDMERGVQSGHSVLWYEHAAFQIKRCLGHHRAKHPTV